MVSIAPENIMTRGECISKCISKCIRFIQIISKCL